MHVFALRFASHHWTPSLTWVVAGGITLLLIAAVWLVSILGMWAYPSQRVAPLASVNEMHLGGSEYSQAVADMEARELGRHRMELVIGDKAHHATLNDMGIRVDAEASVAAVLSRQRQARDTLRSWKFWQPRSLPLVLELDDDKFDDFYETKLAEYHGEPADARLVIGEGRARIRAGETSWRIDREGLERKLLRSAARLEEQITVRVSPRRPEVTAKHLEPLRTEAQQWLDRGLVLEQGDETHPVSSRRLGEWITVIRNGEELDLTLDKDQVRAHIKTLAEDIDEPPEPDRRIVEDGDVIGREEGEPGRKVHVTKSTEAIVSALESGEATATLHVHRLEPGTEDSHTYTATTKGMEALLGHFAASYGGEYGLVLRTMNGKIRASHNGSRRFVTASTYKMYLAYAAYTEIENGNLSSDRDIGPGTVGYCLKRMILYSTNPCATALGDTIGWKRIDALLNEAGFHQTTLNNHKPNQVNKYTTAEDAARFMQRLRAGKLLNEHHTHRLLGHLRNQIYRSGIPAGSSGTVANKIGFLQGYLHDVGVVENGGSGYVLAIYSYGGQWWQFKQLARDVQNVLTP